MQFLAHRAGAIRRGSKRPARRKGAGAACVRLLPFCLVLLAGLIARAAEVLPPKPAKYFNDHAGIVSPETARRLDEQLRQFERETSNQIVVAIFRKMETESSVQDYTWRIAESWAVGQKEKDNGAVLFVFTEPRKMFIQTGYGLEGALPDITCKQIIENELRPAFQAGDFDRGLTAAVDAMIRATRGEYRGSGRVAGDRTNTGSPGLALVPLFFILALLFFSARANRRGTVYTRRGRRVVNGGGWWLGGGNWPGGGGGGFSDGDEQDRPPAVRLGGCSLRQRGSERGRAGVCGKTRAGMEGAVNLSLLN